MRLTLTIKLILIFLLSGSICEANNNRSSFDLTLTEIVSIPWDLSLDEIKNKLPGGNYNEGDPERRVVQNYIISIQLLDLNLTSRLNFHVTFPTNYVERNSSKLIKNLIIECNDSTTPDMTIDLIIKILENGFPAGGPVYRKNTQVGYYIPTVPDVEGVSINWFVNEADNSLSVIMQQTRYK